MRKKGKNARSLQSAYKKSTSASGNSSLNVDYDTSIRPRANSSDIAEERGVSLYPSAKKTEGKILRPQYKDILKGNVFFMLTYLNILTYFALKILQTH